MILIVERHEVDYQNARRWNQCIAVARRETEVFVQIDDVRLRSDFVRQHVKWHLGGVLRIVSGAKFEGPEETWNLAACRRSSLAGARLQERINVPATAIWGCSLSYPRAVLDVVCHGSAERPYDEAMQGYGHHEVEFALRFQKAGGETVYDPAAGVFHKDHTPTAERARGFDRASLVKQGLRANAEYICRKHSLSAFPRW